MNLMLLNLLLEINNERPCIIMDEKEFKTLLENKKELENAKRIRKMQYMMDFGEISIQYDFCLN